MTGPSSSAISICPKAAARRRFWWLSMAAAGKSAAGNFIAIGVCSWPVPAMRFSPSNTGWESPALSGSGLRYQSGDPVRPRQGRRIRSRSGPHRPHWRFRRRPSRLAGRAGRRSIHVAYRDDANAAVPANVKCVIGFYGVYDMHAQWTHDLTTRPNDKIVEKFLGASPMREPPRLFRRLADQLCHRRS